MKSFIFLAVFLVALASANEVWNPVDTAQVTNDALIGELFNFGLDLTLQEGNNEGLIPDTDLALTGVDSVETQVDEGTYYRFTVSLANERGATLQLTYVVEYFPATGVKDLSNKERTISYEAPY